MFLTLSRFFLYGSLFSVLVVLTGTFFPFIGGKYYFFRVAIELSIAALLFWWAFEARAGELEARVRRLVRDPLFIAVSAFVLVFILASLFAHDPHAAFWSNYERGEGGFQMIHYYVFFLLLTIHFEHPREWRFVFTIMMVVASLMILYGVLAYVDLACFQKNRVLGTQNVTVGCPNSGFISPFSDGPGMAPEGFVSMLKVGRFQGSLGNPAYVAPYLLFSMFYATWTWYQGSRKIYRTLGYMLLITFFGAFFVFSQTRGAFLGLVVGVASGFLYLLLTQRKHLVKLLVLLVILGGLGMGTKNYCNSVAEAHPDARVSAVCRLLTINLGEQTFQTRFWTWGSAVRGWQERPLLGWGPENFSAVFDKHFDPRHFIPGQNSETWFDRAHSVAFDYLAETGILGLLSYLSIFVVFYVLFIKRVVIRHMRHGHGHADDKYALRPFEQALLVSIPVAYLVQGLALFDVLPIYLNLFLFLAFTRSVLYSFHHAEPSA